MPPTASTARTAVVKVGSSSITSDTGEPDDVALAKLCAEVADARDRGHQVVLVSSGAIATGLPALGLTTRPTDVGVLQAVAAVGQPLLMARIGGILERARAPRGPGVAHAARLRRAHAVPARARHAAPPARSRRGSRRQRERHRGRRRDPLRRQRPARRARGAPRAGRRARAAHRHRPGCSPPIPASTRTRR